MMQLKHQTGFVPVILIIAALVVGAAVGAGAFFATEHFVKQPSVIPYGTPAPTGPYEYPRPTPPGPVPTPPYNQQEISSWQTLNLAGSKISFKYPPSWQVISQTTDVDNKHILDIKGPEGEIIITWLGLGYGGVCAEQTYQTLFFLGTTHQFCYNNLDSKRSWRLFGGIETPRGVPIDINASANETDTNNVVVKMLATFTELASPTLSSSNGHKACASNADCGANQNCVATGPVRIDGPNQKFCYGKNEAIPL